ncbi:MAG: flagellar basal body P-ring formation chaperone FlgA [Phycisphaerae bacterium]|jgi:flagella basal body P-ring formation protein FlgA
MKTRKINMLIVFVAVFCEMCIAEPVLKIYLPREIQVESETVLLGDIAAVRGLDEATERAGQINLGKFIYADRDMIISREMILGRLTSSGFDASEIEIAGAEKVIVSRQKLIIKAEEISKAAESFLKKNFPDKSVCRYETVGVIDDFVLTAEAEKIELVPSLIASGQDNRKRVSISVVADGSIAGTCEIGFKPVYLCRQAVALLDIKQGQIITRENVEVVQKTSSTAESNFVMPYGMAARRNIAAESIVTKGMVGPVQSEVLVKRNKHVAVVFERPGLSISTVGKAMEDGRAGDCIKVQTQINATTKIIFAMVKDNGTVEPLI